MTASVPPTATGAYRLLSPFFIPAATFGLIAKHAEGDQKQAVSGGKRSSVSFTR